MQRAVGAVIPIATIPLALRELGERPYGAWSATVALTGVLVFTDLGIGSGLLTKLGAIADFDQGEESRLLVSTAYALALIAAFGAGVALTLASIAWDLGAIYDAEGDQAVRVVTMVTLVGFFSMTVLNLVYRIQSAVGQQAAANYWQAAGSLGLLAGMLAVGRATDDPEVFICAVAFVPVIVSTINSAFFFGMNPVGKVIRPSFSLVSVHRAMEFLRTGLKFALLSALVAAALALDPWIVSQVQALEDVPSYTVPMRIFAIVSLVAASLSLPLWPMHAAAIGANDLKWIRRVTVRMTFASVATTMLLSSGIVIFGGWAFRAWLGGAIDPSSIMLLGMAGVVLVQAGTGPLFMVQNAAGVLGPQLLGYALLVVFTVPAKWWVVGTHGFEWVPWITATGFVLLVVPTCISGYRKAMLQIVDGQGDSL